MIPMICRFLLRSAKQLEAKKKIPSQSSPPSSIRKLDAQEHQKKRVEYCKNVTSEKGMCKKKKQKKKIGSISLKSVSSLVQGPC